jgi:hypothetical protein
MIERSLIVADAYVTDQARIISRRVPGDGLRRKPR